MKWRNIIFGIFACYPAFAGIDDDIRVQTLQARIELLQKQYGEKLATLKECEKNTQGFKIAGIATLAATGVGIYANIKIAQSASGASGRGGLKADTRSQEQKNCDACDLPIDNVPGCPCQ